MVNYNILFYQYVISRPLGSVVTTLPSDQEVPGPIPALPWDYSLVENYSMVCTDFTGFMEHKKRIKKTRQTSNEVDKPHEETSQETRRARNKKDWKKFISIKSGSRELE